MKFWIQNGRVIDPKTGLCNMGDIVVENGKIVDIKLPDA